MPARPQTGSEGLLGVVVEITDRLRTLQEVSRRGDTPPHELP